MTNRKSVIRNWLITLLILVITAALMIWQYDYWSGAQRWTNNFQSTFIYKLFNSLPIDYVGTVGSNTTIYIVSSSAVLALYFVTIMLPRVYKSVILELSAGLVVGVAGILISLFGSGVILQNIEADGGKVCLIFNCTIVIMMVLTVEIPSFVKNRKQILKSNNMVSAVCRYGLMIWLVLVSLLFSSCLLGILNKFNESAVTYVIKSFSKVQFTQFITLCILDQFFEETFFRGCIFGNLKKYTPVWVAALISSFCFALWHRNIGQFVYTFCNGLVWCYIYHFTGRLRYTIIGHSVYNFAASLAMRNKYENTSFFPYCEPLFELNASIIDFPLPVCIILALVCCALIIGGILLLKRCRPSESTGILSNPVN